MDTILQVKDLRVQIPTASGVVTAVDGLNFDIHPGETFALLGESGCGKTMTASAIMRILPPRARIDAHSHVLLQGEDLMDLSEAEMRRYRGRDIAMIFQEPMTALNPVLTVAQQLTEMLRLHTDLSTNSRLAHAADLLDDVGIPDPKHTLTVYPHQLSGGLKQRVMIAMALAVDPVLLIADEPTTALDVTIQAQVLELLQSLQVRHKMAMLLITHDLGIVKQMAQRVGVMYAGELVEVNEAQHFFQQPLHPYSQQLFASLPSLQKRAQQLNVIKGTVPPLTQAFTHCRFAERCPHAQAQCLEQTFDLQTLHEQQSVRCVLYPQLKQLPKIELATTQIVPTSTSNDELLAVRNLKVHYPIRKGVFKRTVGVVKAVDGVDITLQAGKTVALVGESGCGKSTIAKAILRLQDTTDGTMAYRDEDLLAASPSRLHTLRNDIQIIFQDPYSSMNPRMMVRDIILEGVLAHRRLSKAEQQSLLESLITKVGLRVEHLQRYPHEFSGGQRQRLCIARALAVKPKLIICDEPTSALDVSVQAQILNLLQELQQEFNMAYLFITHNLAVVAYLADEILVMKQGQIVERGAAQQVLNAPQQAYTQELLSAVPQV